VRIDAEPRARSRRKVDGPRGRVTMDRPKGAPVWPVRNALTDVERLGPVRPTVVCRSGFQVHTCRSSLRLGTRERPPSIRAARAASVLRTRRRCSPSGDERHREGLKHPLVVGRPALNEGREAATAHQPDVKRAVVPRRCTASTRQLNTTGIVHTLGLTSLLLAAEKLS